jgi:hypothetical protein
MKRHFLAAIVCIVTGGCTSYQYAKDVKTMSFDHDVSEGHGVGPIRGESCQELILRQVSSKPSVGERRARDGDGARGMVE